MKRYAAVFLMILLLPLIGFSQGVTTASMKGTVVNESGETMPGANVLVVHIPSGTEYGAATNSNGAFNIRNMRAGGPYRIRVTFVGFEAYVREGMQLQLGETQELKIQMTEGQTQLGEVEVVAAGDVFNKTKTGVGKNVSTEDIEDAPTVGRSLADYTRLNPQAYVKNDNDDGAAISIAGQNNRYNSMFIDGTINNDVFGLSAQGTNGGQTGASPISMDAIEQFQINSSPFDVTQGGFTGGAINAITRSGTNKFEGSVYWMNRNESLAGSTPIGLANFNNAEREPFPEFKNNRFGFRLGGPIVEDKLFFFANLEMLRSQSPQPFVGISNYQGAASISDLEEIRSTLQNEFSYEAGTFRDKNSKLDSDKALFKLNWNINKNHKLMLRHSYTQSDNIDRYQSNSGIINYSNNSEVFPNTTNITALELTSSFGNNIANKFNMGYTDVVDDRDYAGEAFPTVTIFDGNGEIRLGNEPFSTSNLLDQQIFTITNDLNIFVGDHTITIGTHNEFYDMANQFIVFNNGWYQYGDMDGNGTGVDEFLQSVRAVNDPNISPATPSLFLRGVSLVGGQNKIGDEAENIGAFNAYQLGLYVQDEWQVNDQLRLTGGLRFDMPKITTEPRYADDVFSTTIPDLQAAGKNLYGARPGETPSAQIYVSPRFGMNWDVDGEGNTQVRAGAGVFLGRVPFVWPGSMFLNNGANTGVIAAGPWSGQEIPFRPNPENGLTLEDFGRSPDQVVPSGQLDMFAEDFKYPTVFRTSVGVDHKLPFDIVGTLEFQYTKTMNNILVENVNLKSSNQTLDGPDNRPIYAYSGSDRFIDPRYGNIHVISNTSKGHTFDITTQLRKNFSKSFRANISYTYGDSYVLNEGSEDLVSGLWESQEHINGANNIELSRSDFSMGHRVTASMVYRKEFLNNLATTISLFFEGTSGRPMSYVIDGSEFMVNENGTDASLLYVPEDASNLTWDTSGGLSAQEQADAFDQFIENSDYLSSRRGQYAERNASRAPFEAIVDLKIEQEIFADLMDRRQKLEFTLDIFNFTSLLGDVFNKSWGNRYGVGGTYEPIEFVEFQDAANGDYTPVYSLNYDPSQVQTKEDVFQQRIEDSGTYSSRWLMQFGVRYTF